MSDSSPEKRIIDRSRGQPENYRRLNSLAWIALIYRIGIAVWWLLGLRILLAIGASSLLIIAVLVTALEVRFRNTQRNE